MEVSSTNAELENAVAKVSKKTSSYLRAAAKFAVQNNLPLCLASAWSSRAKNIMREIEEKLPYLGQNLTDVSLNG
ncbi:hypothetical protein Y032_0037g3438 [Ancylostoma ceylanicum]|uniref:Uncharacterized protein n=1 Tax=Ancylostoma ceylanicum TaxID=53326 RepID=A0A016UJB4_9BILA|nr:hypothetical protein Y032_0037g3438 [Ancylostoma ceylanicum]